MSTSESDGYRRDDWWGADEPEVETVADVHRDGKIEWRGRRQEKAAHLAHRLLRGTAPALDLVSLVDPGRVPEELTEPCCYPHGEGNREHLRQVRVNPESGALTGGESTGVVLDGTPTDEFLSLVETWLGHCVHEGVIARELADQLLADAESMKRGTDKPDERVLAILVGDVLAGERSTPGDS